MSNKLTVTVIRELCKYQNIE